MPGTTVRIKEETREKLRELQRRTGQGPQELLARAVDQFRRSLILAETNVAYGALRADEAAWAEVEGERAEWEGALADGVEDTEPAQT